MLQIATGKLFSQAVGRENLLRGMLYTNAIFARDAVVQTVCGRIMQSSSYSIHPSVLVYEFTEKMEGDTNVQGGLYSSGVEPYVKDFSVVVSFALNCTCTPDIDLARRLISGQVGLVTGVPANKVVRRFFDKEVWCTPDESKFLESFVQHLIGLPRKTFLGVMKALRTYVNGMHRVADDLELAYTLLVASVESLAQDFDEHQSDWSSVDEQKRKAIDEALLEADQDTSSRVREALVRVEHHALSRRFREFVIANTSREYFRKSEFGTDNDLLLARSDLTEVLKNAYQSRSKYVHQLQPLPDILAFGHTYNDTVTDDRVTHLSLQGLSRLMRNAIIEFVLSQPQLQHEAYDYHLERSGIVQMRLDPIYWLGVVAPDIELAGRDKLEGFLSQLARCLLREPNAALTDLRPVLEASNSFIPGLNNKLNKHLLTPYLTLYFLFNYHVQEHERVAVPDEIKAIMEAELDKPSPGALIAHTLSCQEVSWSLDEHQRAIESYLKQRSSKNGLRFPRMFESAIFLDLADRFRFVGELRGCRKIVALAVENNPGHKALLSLEDSLSLVSPIYWPHILLPTSSAAPLDQ
jgi:hypothetical protein